MSYERDEAMRVQAATEDMIRMREPRRDEVRPTETMRLRKALMPFVLAYATAADPIGDSDLDDEQPRHVTVTLGDCRRAAALLGIHPQVKP
jgi:hypothetical protein